MKDLSHSTPDVCPETTSYGEIVSVFVDYDHPLLQLGRALPWEQITEVMIREWRLLGKNVDGGAGRSLDISLYVPLVVLMLVKGFNSRQIEAYVAENVVARVFISRQGDPSPQIRDHANIARVYGALSQEGLEELNTLILHEAQRHGFADASILSSDTTMQELPIGYPNEPGILRGLAQRCLRALEKLGKQGVEGVESAMEQAQQVLRSVKEHHLFAKSQAVKQQVLERIMVETEQLLRTTDGLVARLGQPPGALTRAALRVLRRMREVAEQLLPQITHWLTTGKVAKGKLLHAGLTQAVSVVRHKAGKRVEFGLPYLLSRLGGGYVFGTLLSRAPDETKMPLHALAAYRERFGPEATPELMVYDRGGYAKTTLDEWAHAGVKQVGVQPKGKGSWRVAEAVRETIRSERGQTEGIIGTLKSAKYSFNKPKERTAETLRMAGTKSILSFNLNKLMRDLLESEPA
jgi:hypothetical protein